MSCDRTNLDKAEQDYKDAREAADLSDDDVSQAVQTLALDAALMVSCNAPLYFLAAWPPGAVSAFLICKAVALTKMTIDAEKLNTAKKKQKLAQR